MKPVTERLWTLLTPWTVSVSPLEDPGERILDVLEFTDSRDALRAVYEHNLEVS